MLEKSIKEVRDELGEKTNDLERYTRNYGIRLFNVPNLPPRASPEVYI